MMANQDHTLHPIIRRQIVSLRDAGHDVFVVDQSEACTPSLQRGRTVVRPVSLQMPCKLVWRILRRIDERHLGEPWWTAAHFAQVVLTGFRYLLAGLRDNADFYQAHDLETLLPAIVVAKLCRRKVVYDAHELTSEQGNPRSLRKRIERRLERLLLPFVDHLVTPNASRAAIYAGRSRLRSRPIVVRNCSPTISVPRTNLLRERLGLEARTRIVVYHGALIEGRALDNLVISAGDFDNDIALVLIGAQTAYFREVLEPLASSVGLRSRVYFIPFIDADRVLDYVASADLGVVIYKNINLNNYLCAPTKLYEYLMIGLPVAVSSFPEMLHLLDELPVGLAFDPDSPSSIAGAVNQFFRIRCGRNHQIEEALASARRQFNWERESQKLLEIFATG